MFTCPLCTKNHADGVRCSKCCVSYCFMCANISEENYRKLGKARQAAIQCTSCKNAQSQGTGAGVAPGTAPAATLDIVLQELRTGINSINERLEQLPPILKDIQIIKENITHFEASLGSLKQELEGNTMRLIQVEERINVLEKQPPIDKDYPLLQAEITKLSNDLMTKDQLLRLNNVEIKGIPIKKNENLLEIVRKIGNIIGQQIEKSDINFVTRARSASQPKPVIVGFVGRYQKQDFVAAAKLRKQGLTSQDLGFTGDLTKIYVNDHLTKENKQLLSKTKKIAVEKNYNYVWVQNSKILTRKNDTSPIIAIKNDSDLPKMK